MDDIVIRGMAKWPNVPAVYGWLTLDRRGAWFIKGEKISNPTMTGFIGRNYAHDGQGRWYFQNGPQRVFVALDYTPLVYRAHRAADGRLELEAHTGTRSRDTTAAWLDEHGAVLLQTDLGIGIVHDKDLDVVMSAFADVDGKPLADDEIERRVQRLQLGEDAGLHLAATPSLVPVRAIQSADVVRRFGFEPRPAEEAPPGNTRLAAS